MTRKFAGTSVGVTRLVALLALLALAACRWGSHARSQGAMPSPLGGRCYAAEDCQSDLVCHKGVCAKEDPTQKAIDDAMEQGEQYGR